MLGHSSSSISEQPRGQEGPWRQAGKLPRSRSPTVNPAERKQNVNVASLFMHLCAAARRQAQHNGCEVKQRAMMNAANVGAAEKQGAYLSRRRRRLRLLATSTKGRLQLDKFARRGKVVSERHLANSRSAACDARRVRIGRREF